MQRNWGWGIGAGASNDDELVRGPSPPPILQSLIPRPSSSIRFCNHHPPVNLLAGDDAFAWTIVLVD
jgi:hypothetical protein